MIEQCRLLLGKIMDKVFFSCHELKKNAHTEHEMHKLPLYVVPQTY